MKKIRIFTLMIVIMGISLTGFSQGGGIWNFQWAIGFPTGETNDFIDQTSFRGFGLEGRGYVTDRLTVGGRGAWHTFYKDFGFVTNEYENATVHGYKRRYINAIPLTVNSHYYFGYGLVLPYVGVGLGAYFIESRDYLGIYYVEEKAWHFGVAPEVGVVIPFGSSNTGFNIAAKYQYAAKTKDTQSVSWIELNIGLSYIF
ncbi:MAG: OmpW family outer membrane protein [bacterium]